MWMGRGSLDAYIRVWQELSVAASTWLERSDRDDPRWTVASTGVLTTHVGADLTAMWRFRRLQLSR